MNKTMKVFIAAIAGMGIVRFALDRHGLPVETVKYFSMSVVIFIGTIYFAIVTKTHKGRLRDAYLLIMPYMIIEVLALGYTWQTGAQTIFHTKEYSFGMPIGVHTIGHLIGGLTWEPLFLFLVMEIVWFVYSRFKRTNTVVNFSVSRNTRRGPKS